MRCIGLEGTRAILEKMKHFRLSSKQCNGTPLQAGKGLQTGATKQTIEVQILCFREECPHVHRIRKGFGGDLSKCHPNKQGYETWKHTLHHVQLSPQRKTDGGRLIKHFELSWI